MLLSHFKIKGFSLDFMRVKFENDLYFDNLEKSCHFIDDDNSNYAVQWWGDWEFYIERSDKYFLIRPVDFPASTMRVRFDGEFVTVDFYGAFFSWECNEAFRRFLIPTAHRFFRVDLALDLVGCSPKQLEKYGVFNLKRHTISDEQTIYYGDFRSNRKIVRIYDKKADIKKKRKQELHPDILVEEQDVTRLEVELRASACRDYGFTFDRLLDPEYCWQVFYSELTTNFIFFPLPAGIDECYAKRKYERGTPEPELRFREACEQALKKHVDIRKIVRQFYE